MITSSEIDDATLRDIICPFLRNHPEPQAISARHFAHYTSAKTAIDILDNQEIWMRSASLMNDFMEITHGQHCLNDALQGETGTQLVDSFGSKSGLFEESLSLISSWIPQLTNNTYITCVSEHDEKEDAHGRLSMWRAYGKPQGVALILKGNAFTLEGSSVGIYASPIKYHNSTDITQTLREIIQSVTNNKATIELAKNDQLSKWIYTAFTHLLLFTKHPGFMEEREWRVVSRPDYGASPLITEQVSTINGTPQIVKKLKFPNNPDAQFHNELGIKNILDRIIIGPCEHPLAIKASLVRTLSQIGISSPDTLVHISGIPLR